MQTCCGQPAVRARRHQQQLRNTHPCHFVTTLHFPLLPLQLLLDAGSAGSPGAPVSHTRQRKSILLRLPLGSELFLSKHCARVLHCTCLSWWSDLAVPQCKGGHPIPQGLKFGFQHACVNLNCIQKPTGLCCAFLCRCCPSSHSRQCWARLPAGPAFRQTQLTERGNGS